ncbi:MAG: type I DNA topoisomerase, partial [Armatimonadetes bacterium]|nr:type I DNA topoisomerase [Armatimonadota bacterium]
MSDLRRTNNKPNEAIIVESPTKTRSLARFLGGRYLLLATKGHIRDLPERGLAVDVDNGFRPTYEIIPGQKKTVETLSKELRRAERVYLACDPDREGEAIAWHVREALDIGERCARIEFNEITERAVLHALEHPRAIDLNRVNAQQARRILDRLVGYLLSPLLQTRVSGWQGRRALSAGRVQSAALRLIVERERQRARFVPREYWRIRALLKPKSRDGRFEAELKKYRGQPVEIPDKKTAEEVTAALRQLNYFVATVERKEVQQPAPPPFRTSTLQREASSKLGLRADETMRLAQELYEGVDLPEGTVGLITYMRTDSTRIAPEARVAAVNFISTQYGADFVGPGSRGKAPRGAQEAHEAIRPTDVFRTPESVAPYLSPRHLALYRLIWRRFVASQMAPAVYDRTRVEVTAGDYVLEAVGRVLKKPGWKLVYGAELPEESNGNGGGAGPDESMSGVEGGPAPPREELAEEGHTEE